MDVDLAAVFNAVAGIYHLAVAVAYWLSSFVTFTLAFPLNTPGDGTLAAPEWTVQVDRADRPPWRTVP